MRFATSSGLTGFLVASMLFLNDPSRPWFFYALTWAAAAVLSMALLLGLELLAQAWYRRKARRFDASLETLLAGTDLEVEAFKDMSYHAAYVVLMHPGLTTAELIARPSMVAHLGHVGVQEGEALLRYAGSYFRTADRFGQAEDGAWWLARSSREARRSMKAAARSMDSDRVRAAAQLAIA